MTVKLVSIRRQYRIVSALSCSVHSVIAKNRFDALNKGREFFGHQCYIANVS